MCSSTMVIKQSRRRALLQHELSLSNVTRPNRPPCAVFSRSMDTIFSVGRPHPTATLLRIWGGSGAPRPRGKQARQQSADDT
ncbi:hypothetical protein D9619_004082 [Psilocybe cf. subviscida]|uniref:Uncharacterized protein n=1 Tax=Psilocybe cf. subviscida TaxID=2480587 RepID=A0A8H5BSH9_9AGAR|nr:hypothetical protein D9619_004082 [Psilocybe cf. subviscida]